MRWFWFAVLCHLAKVTEFSGWQVMAFAAKAGDLSSVPRDRMVEGKNRFLQLSSDYMWAVTCMLTQ